MGRVPGWGGAQRRGPKSLAVFALLGLCFLLTCCGSSGDVQPATPADIAALKAAAAAPQPLQPGEKIHVVVYGEASLTDSFQVDPSGYVSLPVIGTLKAAGLTPQELEGKIAAELRDKYIKAPDVTVEVTEFRPFYILGEVEHPGSFPYIGGLNIKSALAIAGGPTYRAKLSTVLIQHVGESSFHEYELDWSIPILPGDIIEMPRRSL